MLQGEWAESVEQPVVAGDIVVYRELIADLIGARPVTADAIGDANLVILCPKGDGLAEVEVLAAKPGRKVLVVGVADGAALRCYEAGAFYVLPREESLDELRVAVEKAGRGERHRLSERHTRLVFDRLRELRGAEQNGLVGKLTPREVEIAALIAGDLRDKEIARRLFISHSTVKKHVIGILRKLGVSNRREAADLLRRDPGF